MKTIKILLLTIMLTGMNISFAQTARLQVIHNAADPGAVRSGAPFRSCASGAGHA